MTQEHALGLDRDFYPDFRGAWVEAGAVGLSFEVIEGGEDGRDQIRAWVQAQGGEAEISKLHAKACPRA